MTTIGVLFVCTGNICRSPSAEGVFRRLVVQKGLADRITIDSAGVAAWHIGEPPDSRAVAAARRRDVDISGLRARAVVPLDFERFAYILAMDRSHYRDLMRLCPQGKQNRVRMFLSFSPKLGTEEVPDPYYGDHSDFERALDLIEAGARGLLTEIGHCPGTLE